MLGAIAAATVSACTTGGVEIRPIAASQLKASTPSERVVEGRAKLAMGSVGLALESFRRALREDPSSVDALVGLAACYERMGRFDLSSTQYEAALAIAPADVALIDRLAASREAEGKTQQAADLRREAALRRATPKTIAPVPDAAEPVDVAAADAARPTGKSALVAIHEPSPAPANPAPVASVAAMPSAAAVAAVVGQDNRLSSPVEPVASAAPVRDRGPRLVRLSMGEIALVTTPGPLWEQPRPAIRAAARPAVIHLLNAARVAKLAARTRDNMSRRGWSNVSVGDAPAVLATSVIRYPAHDRAAARRLAAQYGFAAVADPSVRFITVYLGRDSVPTG